MKTVDTPPTRQLQDEFNKPLHIQKENIEEAEIEKKKVPVLTFDDTDEKPVIYGNDLKIPAFIRRQHD